MAETLARLFRHAISYHKPDMMLTKVEGAYQPISAREVYRRVCRLHLNLKRVGIAAGDRCALLSENRWEWAVADFALMTAGITSVPLYPTLSAEQLRYMLEHSESRVILVSTQQQLDKVLGIWAELPRLEGIVVFDPVEMQDERVIALSGLIGEAPLTSEESAEFEAAMSAVEPGQLASILYTSGTTGVPKGVMLTHANLASNVRDNGFEIFTSDVCLSFLPLCHVAERMADYMYFYSGATVAYAESMEAVAQNMLEVRPTLALGVPRFFEKVFARVMDAIGSAPRYRQRLFFWAHGVGKASMSGRLARRPLPLGLRLQYWLAERLVFSKLRKRLGGRLRFFVSGSAPLAQHLAEFFYAAGITICEAYGLTETSPLVTTNLPHDLRFGTVGKVIRNVEVRIAADNEILVRGPNVMAGYYKMDQETAKTLVDGWLHTGDLGRLDEDGYLTITDRKKDLLKTSGGKYIAPQPIENQLKSSAFVSTAIVIAEGRRFPSALIVPNFDRLRQYAREQDLPCSTPAELSCHDKIRALLEDEVKNACAGLAQYEQIKKIAIIERELSVEQGEITPTMKVRRHAVETRFASLIEQLYA